MDVFSLFGMPVKSICIISGEYTLMLRGRKDNFQFNKNSSSILDSSNYIIVDTGKKHTQKFTLKMAGCTRESAKKYGLRIRCVEAIGDLLSEIDNMWKPEKFYDNIPSIYLYKVLSK